MERNKAETRKEEAANKGLRTRSIHHYVNALPRIRDIKDVIKLLIHALPHDTVTLGRTGDLVNELIEVDEYMICRHSATANSRHSLWKGLKIPFCKSSDTHQGQEERED